MTQAPSSSEAAALLEPLCLVGEPLTDYDISNSRAVQLDDLQGNILKGHGRDHAAHVFIEFKPDQIDAARDWLRNVLAERITTAKKQLDDAAAHRTDGSDAGPFWVVALGPGAYVKFEHGDLKSQFESEFWEGMAAAKSRLNDPPVSEWDTNLQKRPDAVIIVADIHEANVGFLADALEAEVSGFATVLAREIGKQRRNDDQEGIEHFGYVDGRSQPLMLKRDVDAQSDGTFVWNPACGPKQVLRPDPLGSPDQACGSYFVFRKLEQNVREFKLREQALATAMGLTDEDRELAGAMVVGRFEDGTPVVLSKEARVEHSALAHGVVPNDFNYAGDSAGNRCPLHAHIRKSNPRGSSGVEEKSRHMARRGITYGDRDDDPKILPLLPQDGVGLLFMSYQQSIANQFELIQRFWVNNPDFPASDSGIDPIIGQPKTSAAQHWPKQWGSAGRLDFSFNGFVTLRGGEYFFAPSISGLKNI